ncbi:pilus assembly protein [Dyella koreensis]|uniref:Pilus assembly protein PilY n=1 Tax=Dyella koreensis TaxID=311235 RepID=A0ABW8K791_9GAMM
MHAPSQLGRRFGQALRKLFGTALAIWLLGAVYMPAVAATATRVAVDQQPLTLQPPIPPNIVLMLDDSGSMAWDYMPDACYLNGVTCTGTGSGTTSSGNGTDRVSAVVNDAMIDSNNNGVYYNPTVTYTPPVKADGSSYPNMTDITSVPVNGFSTSSSTVDITGYSNTDIRGENQGSNFSTLYYSTTSSNLATYSNKAASQSDCDNAYWNQSNDGNGDQWSSKTGICTFKYYPTYFQYSQDSNGGAGPYTDYYVAASSCASGDSNCVVASDTSGTAAPKGTAAGQNIANWFAYYHTRILMAKSGLMNAFSGLNKTFRVGFGSIDGNNTSGLPSSKYTYNDTYNNKTNAIANVTPFGDGSSSTDQKTAFWSWIVGEKASNGTPLRQALDQVGQYYQTTQPWSTMSTDPSSVSATTEIACRQSYTILTTDGFWNDDFSGPGNADGTAGTTVKGPNNQSYTYQPKDPFQDNNSDTLADVAMNYWETDLRPSTANSVPTSTADPAFWQHMTTFTMGLGFTPTGIQPVGTTIKQIFDWATGAGSSIGSFSWPTPASNSINNIADLAHAAVNGHGGFYSATSPAAFASGLSDALKRAAERVGTGASLAANSTQLTTGTVAYQANYYTAKWKGDLKSMAINAGNGAISTTPTWQASTQLTTSATANGTVLTFPSRTIYTYNPSATTGSPFVAFKNSTSTSSTSTPPALSSTQLAALGTDAATQMNVVNYLRGDNTLEMKNNGTYRNRDTPLGDIVDSQPVYVGPPNPNEFVNQTFSGINPSSSTSTDDFQWWAVGTTDSSGNPVASAASKRTPLVFVAANDGMLHAFNASTGSEVYAYLPGAVITSGVANLASSGYGGDSVPHQYYNDGELTVADVYLPSLTKINNSAWHTILVGTTGRGTAEAVYALDITDPGNITPLWERSAGDGQTNSNYIGQMTGKPVIAQVADGNWEVLIGNGYNSASGKAALLEFELDNGTLSIHTTDTTPNNGLAAPVAWMDDPTNGVSMEAYAGDLAGRVWTFPLAKFVTTGNGSNAVTTLNADLSTAGTKVFTATDPGGTAQPITAGMSAGRDPITGNVWVFFGTGQYLSSSDLAGKQVQSWYGVIVQSGQNPSSLPSLPTTRSNLVSRSIIFEQSGNPSATPPTVGLRAVSAGTAGDMTSKGGWYMDLVQPVTDSAGNITSTNAQGERMVTPSQFQGNLLLGTTRIPVVTDICNPSGSGWVMAINPFTGTNPSAGFFMANGGSGLVTLPNGTKVAAAGVGFSSLPNNPIFVGGDMLESFDNGSTSSLMTSGSTGGLTRVSWQELINP